MNIKKFLCFGVLSSMMLVTLFSCGGNDKTDDGDDDKPFNYVTLSTALDNTAEAYEMYSASSPMCMEAMGPNLYYKFSEYGYGGFVKLDEDSPLANEISAVSRGGETIGFDLAVYGIIGEFSTIKENLEASTKYAEFTDILYEYRDDFRKVKNYLYSYDGSDLGKTLSNYLYMKNLEYQNHFEITIGKDDRIESFKIYENTDLAYTFNFKAHTLETFGLYSDWVKNGSKINVRISDYKTLHYAAALKIESYYEGKEVDCEGICTGIGPNNDIYVANSDSSGYFGIRAVLSNTSSVPEVGKTIKVHGTILTGNKVVFLNESSWEYTSDTETKRLPVFDEEVPGQQYGDGFFSWVYFKESPYYSDSLTSFNAYVNENLTGTFTNTKDTIIKMICPSILYEHETADSLEFELVIPAGFDATKGNEIYNTLKSLGQYSATSTTNKKAHLENVLVDYNKKYSSVMSTARVGMTIISSSEVSLEPTNQEKIGKATGGTTLPMIGEGTEHEIYTMKIGPDRDYSIESEYNIEKVTKTGYHVTGTVSNEDILNYYTVLESNGFTLTNEQKYGSVKHTVYSNSTGGHVDIRFNASMGGSLSCSIYYYSGDVVRGPTIEEIIDSKDNISSFFSGSDFIRYDDTFDYDYTYFELPYYANRSLGDNPLSVITIDVSSSSEYINYINKYINTKGFTQLKGSDGKSYRYKTRGNSHYVLSKGDVYLDFSTYQTTDYTYLGHNEYEFRVEMAVYKGTEPLNDLGFDSDLTFFSNQIKKEYGDGAGFNVTLPAGSKTECYPQTGDWSFVEYGFLSNDDVFIYPSEAGSANVDAIETAIISGLESSGYVHSFTTGSGRTKVFTKDDTGNSYGSTVGVMKETGKGYVRMFSGSGGADF